LHGDKLGDVREQCGYYCPACNFSNAGSRPVWKRK
jgi:hypothetical protein